MFSVRQKMRVARQLNRVLRLIRRLAGRGMQVRCRRRGVNWDLDLNEAFDLSIYLLGAYEVSTLRAYEKVIRPGDTVFDIGANVGAHTLHFARLVGPAGQVYAFEPTDFAMGKLRSNLRLNPDLAKRVTLQQSFLVAGRTDQPPASIPSSWPVAPNQVDLHPEHFGKAQPLTKATTITADDYCAQAGIARIDFVKIDVDGYEYPVLRGFRQTLQRLRPRILIELAPFVYEGENGGEFEDYVGFLRDLGYDFTVASTGRPLPDHAAALRRFITPGGALNALLTPRPARP
jgi:FkbM family methyltransferase